MKINSKLAIVVFSIIISTLFVFFLISNNVFYKVIADKEADDYIRTKKLLENIINLQGEKLGLLAESISNDGSFLHSALLAGELGYVDRPFEIMSDYINSNAVDVFIFSNDAFGQHITNIKPDINNAVLNGICGTNATKVIAMSDVLLLKCTEINYDGKKIGRLLLGYKLLSNYANILSSALSKKVDIYSNNIPDAKVANVNVRFKISGIIRDRNEIYYSYDLKDLFSGIDGFIVVNHGKEISLFTQYKSSRTAMVFYGTVFILMMILLYGITWLMVSRKLQQIHKLIQLQSKRKSIQLDAKEYKCDEISEINNTLQDLFRKLDEYEASSKANAALIAIGSSTAMIAHDVRRPLSSMKSILKILPMIKDDPAQIQKHMSEVDRAITNTENMLNEILDFSRDSTALNRSEHDPQTLITSALGDALRNHPNCEMKMNYDLRHAHMLDVDGARVIRVLTNIIDNALGAMKRGGDKCAGELWISTEERAGEGETGTPVPSVSADLNTQTLKHLNT